ncbi:hypothetical protein HZY91_04955 [Facklamia sp. DSM 111018]|uniref:DUF4352 domain-containing protein n=1 Tax=Facklamia lactis TaxID=2749967 RepID=A0ABS0LQ05_9LACT|nr:hypothetical protein [Facklamia lactis]MBG9986240.1 hypothetical protein [Facklamia lactis]
MQTIQIILTWLNNNRDIVALIVSIFTLIITIIDKSISYKNSKINLSVHINSIYRLTPKMLFVEISITNNSSKEVVIQGSKLCIDNKKGEVHDIRQLFTVKNVNKNFHEPIYINEFPITIAPFNAQRLWLRYNFNDDLPLLAEQTNGKIFLVCFGKNYEYEVNLPVSLTESNFLQNI